VAANRGLNGPSAKEEVERLEVGGKVLSKNTQVDNHEEAFLLIPVLLVPTRQ
jgi:hypothetical protein